MVGTLEIEHAYIGVMGVTGAGKSSFVRTCSGKDVPIGHSLVSCTTDIEDVSFMYNERLRIHLIDTPGFDDTNRSDVEILQDISHWLAVSFQNIVRLKGIIFLHRISDPRMTGKSLRSLSMFKKLCGENAFKSCILVTTMWSQVEPAEGERREKELMHANEFWGLMVKRGSVVKRYHNSKNSAHEIIDYILSMHPKDPVVLDIRDELVTQKKPIHDTSAVVELNAEMMRERQRHQAELERMKQEMQEAIKARDKVMRAEFQEEIDALQKQIQKSEGEQRKLTQTLEKVSKQKEAEFEAFKTQLQQEQDEANRKYQQDLERQRRKAEERARALSEMYETELQSLQKRDSDLRRQQEQSQREMLEQQEKIQVEALAIERALVQRESEAARQLERKWELQQQQQQKAYTEELKKEKARMEKEFEAARQQEREREMQQQQQQQQQLMEELKQERALREKESEAARQREREWELQQQQQQKAYTEELKKEMARFMEEYKATIQQQKEWKQAEINRMIEERKQDGRKRQEELSRSQPDPLAPSGTGWLDQFRSYFRE